MIATLIDFIGRFRINLRELIDLMDRLERAALLVGGLGWVLCLHLNRVGNLSEILGILLILAGSIQICGGTFCNFEVAEIIRQTGLRRLGRVYLVVLLGFWLVRLRIGKFIAGVVVIHVALLLQSV